MGIAFEQLNRIERGKLPPDAQHDRVDREGVQERLACSTLVGEALAQSNVCTKIVARYEIPIFEFVSASDASSPRL